MSLNGIPTGPAEAIAKCTRQRGGALSHFPGARVRPFRPFRPDKGYAPISFTEGRGMYVVDFFGGCKWLTHA